jgi:SAM-dependent methyltransferase
MRICTIVARNYLAYARVLAESFLAQDPVGECVVLVIDDIARKINDRHEPFRVVRPDELGIERFEGMAAMYDVTELATAAKPWLLEHLLAQGEGAPVAYFDPDICFYAPVDEIEHLAREHELVLTPHITAPLPDDGRQPDELALLASGTYNLGFVAMAPGARTQELLEWWQKRLRYDCVIDHALGYFVDQRWFDLVPNTFAGTAVLRDPGMNVAYWNLHERTVTRDPDGTWLVNGVPLRFFHFSGFNPDQPNLLSKHQTRTRLGEFPELARLCTEFSGDVRARRREDEDGVPYAWGALGDGRTWDRRLRRLYRVGEREGAFRLSPFEPAGAQEFFDWLNESALEAATPQSVSSSPTENVTDEMHLGVPADGLFPERFVPGEMHGLIEAEHLARYHWASACVSGLRVLDAGCGNGYGSLLLLEAGATTVTGIDIAQEAIEAARKRAVSGVQFVLGDISDLPFEDDSFDVAVCFEAIEHVHDQPRTLDELHRVLVPAGLLIISSPNRGVYQEGNPHHTHEYTPDELRAALEDRFANVRLRRQQAWLLSMVCDDETLGETDPARPLGVEVRKVAAAPGRETFTLALASAAQLPDDPAVAIVTDVGELDAWRSRVRSAEAHLERARRLTVEATAGYESAHASYTSAHAAYIAIHTAYENALTALEVSRQEQARSEERLKATSLIAEELTSRDASLAAELSTLRVSLATLRTSRSWRVTAPLRAAGRACRNVRTRGST